MGQDKDTLAKQETSIGTTKTAYKLSHNYRYADSEDTQSTTIIVVGAGAVLTGIVVLVWWCCRHFCKDNTSMRQINDMGRLQHVKTETSKPRIVAHRTLEGKSVS